MAYQVSLTEHYTYISPPHHCYGPCATLSAAPLVFQPRHPSNALLSVEECALHGLTDSWTG